MEDFRFNSNNKLKDLGIAKISKLKEVGLSHH